MIFAIFVAYPVLALLAGAVLWGIGARSGARKLSTAGALWLAYALYEYLMKTRVLCTGECNIRVDLLLIYPFLLVMTVIGIVSAVRRRRPPAAAHT